MEGELTNVVNPTSLIEGDVSEIPGRRRLQARKSSGLHHPPRFFARQGYVKGKEKEQATSEPKHPNNEEEVIIISEDEVINSGKSPLKPDREASGEKSLSALLSAVTSVSTVTTAASIFILCVNLGKGERERTAQEDTLGANKSNESH